MNENKPKNVSGGRIRRLRLRLRWSVERLAAEVAANGARMSERDIARIEDPLRQRKVFDGELLAFSKALGTTTHWLVTGREPKTFR